MLRVSGELVSSDLSMTGAILHVHFTHEETEALSNQGSCQSEKRPSWKLNAKDKAPEFMRLLYTYIIINTNYINIFKSLYIYIFLYIII